MRNTEVVETISYCLPSGSMIDIREELTGMGSEVIFDWADTFVKDCEHLTVVGRNVIMILYGYGIHMTCRSLAILHHEVKIV